MGLQRDVARRDSDYHRRSEEHTSELQSQSNLVCRLLLEKKKNSIGNPCVFDKTVTSGVVSASRRSDVGTSTYQNDVTTDQTINLTYSHVQFVHLSRERL